MAEGAQHATIPPTGTTESAGGQSTSSPSQAFDQAAQNKKKRTSYADLGNGQQGLAGLLIFLLMIFGQEKGSPLMAAVSDLTGLQEDELQGLMTGHSSAEEIAEQLSFDPDGLQAAVNKAPAFNRSSAFTGNESGIKLKMPVEGATITDHFRTRAHHPVTGNRAHHDGIDLDTANNTAIKAPADGKVVYAGASSGYGNIIILDHGHGVYTLYGHLDSNDNDLKIAKEHLRTGEAFKAGNTIGYTGHSGIGTGAHLHYEVLIQRKDGEAPININPEKINGRDLKDENVQRDLINSAISSASLAAVTTRVAALKPNNAPA